jgi:hypothetical protein
MAKKPIYKKLEQRVKELEREAPNHKRAEEESWKLRTKLLLFQLFLGCWPGQLIVFLTS